jgi:DNA recombination protein Rad52
MALSDTQVRQLKAKLDPKHVKSRRSGGTDLRYVEGWHVIAEANRIFGFDAWDRRTHATDCIWSGASGDCFAAAYTARVQVRVRAGDIAIIRDGSGSGEGRASTRGQAHDLALKAAETDATKRALATFGNPFGLALYDRDLSGVRKPRGGAEAIPVGPFILYSASSLEEARFETPSDFAGALREALSGAPDIEELFAIWEQNVDAVRAVNRALRQDHLPKSGAAPQLVDHFKRCAVALARPRDDTRSHKGVDEKGTKVDKSLLAISEPRRLRSKKHLRHVAKQPCVICGRAPSHAHHLRHAQTRGLALKVSDEFTVPVCAIHHDEIHRTAKEEAWWRQRGIDPLPIAAALWRASCGANGGSPGQSEEPEAAAKGAEAQEAAGSRP